MQPVFGFRVHLHCRSFLWTFLNALLDNQGELESERQNVAVEILQAVESASRGARGPRRKEKGVNAIEGGKSRAAALAAVIWMLATVAMVAAATPALAASGPKPIKQPSTFPIKINQSGSYIVTSNLVVTSKNQTVLKVTASYVTIDLGGFTISGPDNGGTGIGVAASSVANVLVQNGSVSGFGGTGVALGDSSTARNISAVSNGGVGISAGSGSLVSNCVASGNGGFGLSFTDATSGYSNCVVTGSSTVSGGTSLGNNLCNGASCP
jgi:hypothetical protein